MRSYQINDIPKPIKKSEYNDENCTFHPKINKNKIPKSDFFQRQEEMKLKKQENQIIIKENVYKDESLTFNPKINKISKILIESEPNRKNENFDSKVKRLYENVI